MDVQAKIMAARFGIQFEEPIAGMVACQYALSPSNVPDTVLVNDDKLLYNSDWVETASNSEIVSAILAALYLNPESDFRIKVAAKVRETTPAFQSFTPTPIENPWKGSRKPFPYSARS